MQCVAQSGSPTHLLLAVEEPDYLPRCVGGIAILPNQLNQMQLVLRPVGNHLKLSDEIKLSATEFGSSGQHSGSLRPESNQWMLPVASCELHMLSIAIVIAATTIPNSDDQWTTH